MSKNTWKWPRKWLEEIKHGNKVRQRPTLLLQNLFIAIKHPHNSLSSCYSSLLIRLTSSDILMTGATNSSPSAKFERVWFRLRFRNFFKGTLLPHFNTVVKLEILGIVFQHLEYIYSVVRTNWCVFFLAYWVWQHSKEVQNVTEDDETLGITLFRRVFNFSSNQATEYTDPNILWISWIPKAYGGIIPK